MLERDDEIEDFKKLEDANMENKTIIEKPEELVEYGKISGTNVKLTEERATLVLDIMNNSGEKIFLTDDGKIGYTNRGIPEGETVDDLINYVSFINYVYLGTTISQIYDNAVETKDFVEFCKLKKQEEILDKNMSILIEMFNESTFGKECQGIADFLSLKSMKEKMIKPVHDYLYELAYSYYGDETDRIIEEDFEMMQKDPEGWQKEKEMIHERVLKENEERLKKENQNIKDSSDQTKQNENQSKDVTKKTNKPNRYNKKGKVR